jgi:hypothetical protein
MKEILVKVQRWVSGSILMLGLACGAFVVSARAQQDEKKAKTEEHKAAQHKAPAHTPTPAHQTAHRAAAPAPQTHRAAAPAPQTHRAAAPPQTHRAAAPAPQTHRSTPARQTQHAQTAHRQQPRALPQPAPQRASTTAVKTRRAARPATRENRAQYAPTQPPAIQPHAGRSSRAALPQSDQPSPSAEHARLPEARQRQLITQQQQRVAQYRARLNQQQSAAQQYEAELQQQHRQNEYLYEQDYIAHERQQDAELQREHDYYNDPYFYSPPIYRYSRSGSYYQVNEYEANMIRRAINIGYDQGYRMGIADRRDNWRGGFRNSFAYRDANYGYDGYYGDESTYNYYFRQGFTRGYDDGFAGAFRYGAYNNGSYNILGNILSSIFHLQSLR